MPENTKLRKNRADQRSVTKLTSLTYKFIDWHDSFVIRQVSGRKVAGSLFNVRTDNAVLPP